MLLSSLIDKEKLSVSRFYSGFLVSASDTGLTELLPSDNHALAYPLVFDAFNKEVRRGELNFFNKALFQTIKDAPVIAAADYTWKLLPRKRDKCLVINLLDNCYGHSLLKMFNMAAIDEQYGHEYDLVVITPPSLAQFLDPEKVSFCTVNLTFQQLTRCHDLLPLTEEIRALYQEIDFPFLNTYLSYQGKENILGYFRLFEEGYALKEKSCLVFYYRKDRKRRWGGRRQKLRIVRYFSLLRPYFNPGMNFVVIGDRDEKRFPDFIKDYRTWKYTTETEYQYTRILAESLVVAGVHGSHLILPSLLSSMVIHLLPGFKIRNTAEDMINLKGNRIMDFYENIQIQGGAGLFSIRPRKLARLTLLYLLGYVEKKFKTEACKEPLLNEDVTDQTGFILRQFPGLRYQVACALRERLEKRSLRLHRIFNGFRP